MPKTTDLPLKRSLIAFYEGDVDTLAQFYPGPGYNMVVRELVHNHVLKLRERANREGVALNVKLDYDEPDLGAILGTPAGLSGDDVST